MAPQKDDPEREAAMSKTEGPPVAASARRRFRITRDGILFVTGLAGIIYETIANHGDNPTLLITFMAMIGLPVFLRGDEVLSRRAEKELQESAQTKPEESP